MDKKMKLERIFFDGATKNCGGCFFGFKFYFYY